MDTKKLIGWNVKRLRVADGLTQMQLALDAQLDRVYVGEIERGEANATVSALEALARVLKVPVAELFTSPAKMTPIAGLAPGRKHLSAAKIRKAKKSPQR